MYINKVPKLRNMYSLDLPKSMLFSKLNAMTFYKFLLQSDTPQDSNTCNIALGLCVTHNIQLIKNTINER